jgi:hypothetical protein
LLEVPSEAEGIRQLAVGRISEDPITTPGDHRCIRLGHLEEIEQFRHFRVGLQVEPCERHEIPGQEVADPEGLLRIAGAHHARARELARFAEDLPPGDECLQDRVADVGMAIEDLAEGVERHLVDFAFAARHAADEGWGAGHRGHLAGELAGPKDRDRPRSVPEFIDESNLARLHDGELAVTGAGLEQSLLVAVPFERSE